MILSANCMRSTDLFMLMNKIEIRRFIYRNGKKYWAAVSLKAVKESV